MGLLFRIFQSLYLIGLTIIRASLIDGSYSENQFSVWLANFLTILALVGGFSLGFYLLIWAISLEIFVRALVIAYLEAWLWEKFSDKLTSLVREIYLISSTVGYTVFMGAVIQIDRMSWAGGTALVVYWIFLFIFGLTIWGITVCQVTELAEDKPGFFIKKIEYKQHFRSTKIAKKITPANQIQAYLKRMN